MRQQLACDNSKVELIEEQLRVVGWESVKVWEGGADALSLQAAPRSQGMYKPHFTVFVIPPVNNINKIFFFFLYFFFFFFSSRNLHHILENNQNIYIYIYIFTSSGFKMVYIKIK